ncbi:ser-thr-rich glycosyl-phosphatidyl-inositol-anchored membrane family domain-containing protein [Ophiocordyceps camponoti-floridani]|uniref:Ser-thr-rich glycosyl-phosphatidyl-inositol-anchored membrane family domain-containing protein n=1 Tax=Ophiocordyceps camponoti-floridani TaxID=2030778 RepID=A0A8H4VGA9_9HYPO|nr:ser-thr-rich glycosyl-phosphatidyl-inositol-anchored membrane family domain-containing protein [Ophiocordyceps camponoti-floridani]
MRVAFSIAALVATAFAQTADFDPVYKPNKDEDVPAGQDYKITWDPRTRQDALVNLMLIGGADEKTMEPIPAPEGSIATGIPNSQKSFIWPVHKKLGSKKYYGIKIELADNASVFQYSPRFKIVGGEAAEGKTIILSSTSHPASVGPTSSMAAYPVVTSAAVKSVDCGSNSTTLVPKTTRLAPAPAPAAARTNNSTVLNPANKSGNSSIPVAPTSGSAALSTSLVSVLGGLLTVVLAL